MVTKTRAREIVKSIQDETLVATIDILKDHGMSQAAAVVESIRVSIRFSPILTLLDELSEGKDA